MYQRLTASVSGVECYMTCLVLALARGDEAQTGYINATCFVA